MSKRGLHIDLIEHFQHKGIGRRDLVERHGQIGPHDQRDLIGGVVAHERLITGRLAAVIVDGVRSPAQCYDAVPVLLPWFFRVLRPQAVKPKLLVLRIEHVAGNQRLDPGCAIVGGGDGAPGCPGKGVVQTRVVVGLKGPGGGRGLNCSRIRRLPTKATEELP